MKWGTLCYLPNKKLMRGTLATCQLPCQYVACLTDLRTIQTSHMFSVHKSNDLQQEDCT